MTDIVKADIFFFVTTIAVIVISVLLVALLMYAMKILRDVRHISDTARKEIDEVVKDIGELRINVKKEGSRFGVIASTLSHFLFKRGKGRKNDKKL